MPTATPVDRQQHCIPRLIRNATLVLDDDIIDKGQLLIGADGNISALSDSDIAFNGQVIDAGGALLVPGLIDLHCDAIEKTMEPRRGAPLPATGVMDQIDRINVSAGITTTFHAIAFGQGEERTDAEALVAGILSLQQKGRIDHRLHCRYEISSMDANERIHELIDSGVADMISLMDHSPGQGQFKNLEAFVTYYTRNHQQSRDQAIAFADVKSAGRDAGQTRAQKLTQHAIDKGVAVASHDDDSPERVAAIDALGIRICEFPINLDTARAARARGLHTVLGAPNVVRGGSQSGSMRALDALLDGCCDCLCSDYVPWTLLQAAMQLPDLTGWDLGRCLQTVTAAPAAAANLTDRGRLQAGLRADLVLVDPDQRQVQAVWSAGRCVHRSTAQGTEPLQDAWA